MAYVDDTRDPLEGGEKVPSLSFRDVQYGSVFTLEVLEAAKAIQTRNFTTNEPNWWDEQKTQPKMAAVINVRVHQGPHSVGEDRSIWATIPSDLFAALKAAQKEAGSRIAPGGTLHLKFVGETKHKDPKNNPIKNYAAKYEAPTATGPDPFFAGQTVPPPPAQQRAQPVTPPRSPYATPATTTTAPGTKPKGW